MTVKKKKKEEEEEEEEEEWEQQQTWGMILSGLMCWEAVSYGRR